MFINTNATFMSTFHRELKMKAFGKENPAASAKKVCWRIVTLCVRTLFQELYEVRVEAESVHASVDNANGLYLWGVLQAHRVIQNFMDHKFSMHPAFYPQLMMFLFENVVPCQDFEELSKVIRDLKGLPNQLDNSQRC